MEPGRIAGRQGRRPQGARAATQHSWPLPGEGEPKGSAESSSPPRARGCKLEDQVAPGCLVTLRPPHNLRWDGTVRPDRRLQSRGGRAGSPVTTEAVGQAGGSGQPPLPPGASQGLGATPLAGSRSPFDQAAVFTYLRWPSSISCHLSRRTITVMPPPATKAGPSAPTPTPARAPSQTHAHFLTSRAPSSPHRAVCAPWWGQQEETFVTYPRGFRQGLQEGLP